MEGHFRKLKILMPDLMKIEYNIRSWQEANSLMKAGYDVKMVGFSNQTKKRNLLIKNVNFVSFYLDDRRSGFGKIRRYLTAIRMILSINIYILFYKADIYHAKNFHVLPACYFSALIQREVLQLFYL